MKGETPSGVVSSTAAGRDALGIVRQNERIRGRLKADQRAQWNQGRENQSEYPRMRRNNEN